MSRRVLSGSIFAVLATVVVAAGQPSFQTQGAWSYWKRSSGPGDNPVIYFASIRSIQDSEVFLVVACEAVDVVTASLMHADAFTYLFAEVPIRVNLRLDDEPDITVTAALVQKMQLTVGPRHARILVPLISRSAILSAFVEGRDGKTHGYHFRLQPNDLALQDIETNCYRQKS